MRDLPAAGRLAGEPLAQATIAGAAPAPLVPLIERISADAADGVEVVMKGEIPIRFGAPAAAARKWAAAAAVLADPRLQSLTYVDVRVPERPAVGGAGATEVETAAPETVPVRPLICSPRLRPLATDQPSSVDRGYVRMHDSVPGEIVVIDTWRRMPYGHSHVEGEPSEEVSSVA